MSMLRDNDHDAAPEAAESASPGGDANTGTDLPEPFIERDALFHVLRNERRRRALRYLLADDEEVVQLCTLAESVAADEFDTTVDALHWDERQRVYVSLYQSHLPQLADAGIVEFDQDQCLITTTPHTQAVEPFLERDGLPERDIPRWLWALLAGTGLGIVFMLLVERLGPVHTVVLTVLVVLVAFGVEIVRRRFDVEPPLHPPASR